MLDLDIDQQFAIHATAVAIKEFDREELEEAFVEMLYNKAIERQTFINIGFFLNLCISINSLISSSPQS